MHIAGKSKGSTGQVLLQLLEMRLDNIVFRLNMASTIPGARQLVNHRHILVNGHIVDIPSYRCKPRDIITTKNNERYFDLIKKSIARAQRKKKKLHKIILKSTGITVRHARDAFLSVLIIVLSLRKANPL